MADALPEWIAESAQCVSRPSTIDNYQKMVARLPQNLVLGQLTAEQASKPYLQQVERVSAHGTACLNGNAAPVSVGGAAVLDLGNRQRDMRE